MTAEEEAKSIIDIYIEPTEQWSDSDGWVVDKELAKQCAKIHCTGIIEALHRADTGYNLIEEIGYWQQVKQEIEKL